MGIQGKRAEDESEGGVRLFVMEWNMFIIYLFLTNAAQAYKCELVDF